MSAAARAPAASEEGSVLLLAIAAAALALALVFVAASATSLHLAQRRLDALADAAALAAADGDDLVLVDDAPVARLRDDRIAEHAAAVIERSQLEAELVEAGTADGRSVRVTVRGRWHAPLVSPFVPDGVELEAAATSRTEVW